MDLSGLLSIGTVAFTALETLIFVTDSQSALSTVSKLLRPSKASEDISEKDVYTLLDECLDKTLEELLALKNPEQISEDALKFSLKLNDAYEKVTLELQDTDLQPARRLLCQQAQVRLANLVCNRFFITPLLRLTSNETHLKSEALNTMKDAFQVSINATLDTFFQDTSVTKTTNSRLAKIFVQSADLLMTAKIAPSSYRAIQDDGSFRLAPSTRPHANWSTAKALLDSSEDLLREYGSAEDQLTSEYLRFRVLHSTLAHEIQSFKLQERTQKVDTHFQTSFTFHEKLPSEEILSEYLKSLNTLVDRRNAFHPKSPLEARRLRVIEESFLRLVAVFFPVEIVDRMNEKVRSAKKIPNISSADHEHLHRAISESPSLNQYGAAQLISAFFCQEHLRSTRETLITPFLKLPYIPSSFTLKSSDATAFTSYDERTQPTIESSTAKIMMVLPYKSWSTLTEALAKAEARRGLAVIREYKQTHPEWKESSWKKSAEMPHEFQAFRSKYSAAFSSVFFADDKVYRIPEEIDKAELTQEVLKRVQMKAMQHSFHPDGPKLYLQKVQSSTNSSLKYTKLQGDIPISEIMNSRSEISECIHTLDTKKQWTKSSGVSITVDKTILLETEHLTSAKAHVRATNMAVKSEKTEQILPKKSAVKRV